MVGPEQVAFVIQYTNVVTRHRPVARPWLRRAALQPDAGRGDRPAGLGLPPMVVHRLATHPLQPFMGAGIQLFTRQEQLPQRAEVMVANQFALRVFLADGAHGRRCTEQRVDLVLLHHPPIGRSIRGADRLAFVEHRGTAAHQRPIDDQ
ncbi:hypothetical protein D3C76_1401650 [compost metagenome]